MAGAQSHAVAVDVIVAKAGERLLLRRVEAGWRITGCDKQGQQIPQWDTPPAHLAATAVAADDVDAGDGAAGAVSDAGADAYVVVLAVNAVGWLYNVKLLHENLQ